jgi:lipoprotein-releasing system permease protein
LKVAGFIANRVAFNPRSGSGGQKSFSRFIIRLSIVATMISVAVMIITLAFVNGFQASVSQKVFNFFGHIHIQETQAERSIIAEDIPILKNDSLARIIRKMPGVQSIHPFASRYAVLKTKEGLENVAVKGVDSSFDYSNFKPFMQEGRMLSFNDSSYNNEIILSAYTANQLRLKLNDRVWVYFWQADGKLRERRPVVIGIYKTGIEDYDKHFAVADLRLVQRLNNWQPNMIGGYEIFLTDYRDIENAEQRINDLDAMHPDVSLLGKIKDEPELENDSLVQTRLQSLDAVGIRNIAPNIFDWLNMQETTRWVLIIIMAIVAVINLIICLIILVLERIRMIGVLKALGATDWTVQNIFLRHSLFITLTGVVIGTLLGLGILYLQEQTGFIRLSEEAYYLSKAAVKISVFEVVLVAAGTLAVCLLVLMIPSILVRKVQPVKAIHFR